MKPILMVLLGTLLAATTIAADAPAQLTLGAPKRQTYPATKDSEAFTLIEFHAKLTNTSKKPIWFYGQLENDPFYEAFMRRSKSARWLRLPYDRCGVGTRFQEVAAGKSMSFTTIAPADSVGHQYRVRLNIYTSLGRRATSVETYSKTALLR